MLRELNGDKWLLLSAEEIVEQLGINRDMLSFYEEEGVKGVDRLSSLRGTAAATITVTASERTELPRRTRFISGSTRKCVTTKGSPRI